MIGGIVMSVLLKMKNAATFGMKGWPREMRRRSVFRFRYSKWSWEFVLGGLYEIDWNGNIGCDCGRWLSDNLNGKSPKPSTSSSLMAGPPLITGIDEGLVASDPEWQAGSDGELLAHESNEVAVRRTHGFGCRVNLVYDGLKVSRILFFPFPRDTLAPILLRSK
jgi:hypothetical protein